MIKRHLLCALSVAVAATISSQHAARAQAFLGEVETFAFNFCPVGWAPLKGQLLPINQNQALFALLGITFGGDGKTSFALPTGKPVFTADNRTTLLQCIALTGVFPARN